MRKIDIDRQEFAALHQQDLTNHQLAKHFGCSKAVIERRRKLWGLPEKRTGPKRGERHPEWRGGRRKVGRYWYIYSPNHPHTTKQRYVAEHRLVMEETLGRFLDPQEVVHHINNDPQDNRPENLELFASNAAHLQSELAGRCPQWSEEGRAIVVANCQQNAKNRLGTKRGG